MNKDNFVVKRIKELLVEKNISRYVLAQKSGIPLSSVCALINRNSYPSVITLEKICNGFGLTLAEFFSEDKNESQATLEEREFLKSWRQLDERQKAQVKGYMNRIMEE